jgi:hypothetical protein
MHPTACWRRIIASAIPDYAQEKIERPIIVVGLPRSGTTHLLNLLASDTRLRSLPLWEVNEPLPNPNEPPREDGLDPRWVRCNEQWQMAQQNSPLTAAMHPMDPDHFHEDLELMCPDFASYNYEWMSRVPGWRDAYYAEDQTPHYRYQKEMLQIMQHAAGDTRPKRWVNKCPQHLEQLRVLKEVYPDATVVITYRDPVDSIQSAATMMGYGERMRYPSIDTKGLLEYWSDRVDHLLRACVADRDVWPEAQRVDVPFDADERPDAFRAAGPCQRPGWRRPTRRLPRWNTSSKPTRATGLDRSSTISKAISASAARNCASGSGTTSMRSPGRILALSPIMNLV